MNLQVFIAAILRVLIYETNYIIGVLLIVIILLPGSLIKFYLFKILCVNNFFEI